MHWAAHKHTAAEVIYQRADSEKEYMGLTSWQGKSIKKADVEVAKNYLNKEELDALNKIVTAYLDIAEVHALNHEPMYMKDWIETIDDYLKMTRRDILKTKGTVTHKQALEKAHSEYEKYKKISESLVELENKRNNFYTKSPMNLEEFREKGNVNFGNVSLDDLVMALKKFREREKYNKPISTRITRKEYSVERRIEDIRKILQVRESVLFLELFNEGNKEFLIVTFLAVLTMSKDEEILLRQEDNFKPIIIERKVK